MVSLASRTGRQLQRYNHQGWRQVVGCIPYRFRKTNRSPSIRGTLVEDMEVLMISSQKSPRMMFPKGGWEIDESMEVAALRETEEEAGVLGDVGAQLGGTWRYKSKSQGSYHEGYMFPLLVKKELDVWPEQSVRQRRWMTVNEAREACVQLWMKEALECLVCRFMHRPRKEEERKTQTPCSLEYLRTEEARIGIVAQNGEEDVDCFLMS